MGLKIGDEAVLGKKAGDRGRSSEVLPANTDGLLLVAYRVLAYHSYNVATSASLVRAGGQDQGPLLAPVFALAIIFETWTDGLSTDSSTSGCSATKTLNISSANPCPISSTP